MTEFSSFLAFDRRKNFFLWGLDQAFSSNRTGPLLQISHYPSCKSSLQNFALYTEGTVAKKGSPYSLQYTRGVRAGKKSVRIPADLGWSVHTYLCG